MPDHVHALLTPAREVSLERAVQFIKGGFSFRLKSQMPVWQPSFTNHRVRDLEDIESHQQYIWTIRFVLGWRPVRTIILIRPPERISCVMRFQAIKAQELKPNHWGR